MRANCPALYNPVCCYVSAPALCSTGVHDTGMVLGCLRRLQSWSLTAVIDEVRVTHLSANAVLCPPCCGCAHAHCAWLRFFAAGGFPHQNRNFAASASVKTRHMNEVFVEMFDADLITLPVEVPRWLAVRSSRLALRRPVCSMCD